MYYEASASLAMCAGLHKQLHHRLERLQGTDGDGYGSAFPIAVKRVAATGPGDDGPFCRAWRHRVGNSSECL